MDRFTYQYYYQANGQLMATYNSELYNGTQRTTTLEEQYIYGSNRIGTLKANKGVYFNGTLQPAMIDIQSNKIGKKRYELTNHLGNVLATISDRKVYNSTDGYYESVITMKADYYAFGMLQPGRFEGVSDTRHLFNGMEQDMEVSGEGNSYTTEFRQYDPRLGRWKSLDPLMASFPWQSPYVAFDNNPVYFVDPLGLEGKGGGKKKGDKKKKGNGKEKGKKGSNEFNGHQDIEQVDLVFKDTRTFKQKLEGVIRRVENKIFNGVEKVGQIMKDAERWLDWKGDGDNSGFIKNGAPLVNPEADGSQQGGAIKKTKYKEKPIDVKLFGLGKGWKINRSKIESLKDFAKHLEKFNKNVEKIEKEVEGIKDALTTEGSEPVIEKVGEKMVTEEGGIRTIIESQDTIKIRKIQHPI